MKSVTCKAVLFDLDGTLLDTALDLHAATNYVLAQHQLPPLSIEQARAVTSDGALALLKAGFGEQLSHHDADTLRNTMLAYYHENISVYSRPFAGIESLINDLDAREIPWGIVTNKPEGLTKKLLTMQPVFKNCQIMIAADTLPEKKPHPMPLLFAAERLNVQPQECLYVGDHDRDVLAGKRAEMVTVSVAWGYFGCDTDPLAWQADHHIDHPEQILSLL